MSCFIYVLRDPMDDTVRYVGITDNAYVRFLQHIRCEGPNEGKNEWIRQLRDTGMIPSMKIIEVVETQEEALIREVYWIKYYLEEGTDLYNIIGNGGIPRRADGTVIRRQKALLKYWRKRRGKSIEALAKEAHVSTITITRIENTNLMPRADVLERLSRTLGISMEELIVDATDEEVVSVA